MDDCTIAKIGSEVESSTISTGILRWALRVFPVVGFFFIENIDLDCRETYGTLDLVIRCLVSLLRGALHTYVQI